MRDLKTLLFALLTINSFAVCAQTKTEPRDWKVYSEKVDNRYNVSFEYPSYFKFDRVENCMCLGKPDKNGEYDNTMDWGIWIDEPQNYRELGQDYYKENFGNDVIIKRDSVMISTYKALRIIARQPQGAKYAETIILVLNDCVFEMTNRNKASDDFIRFYKSIIIRRI